jgi:hypothetical protein
MLEDIDMYQEIADGLIGNINLISDMLATGEATQNEQKQGLP